MVVYGRKADGSESELGTLTSAEPSISWPDGADIRSVRFDDHVRGMQVWPNPARNVISISLDAPVTSCEIRVINMEGKPVLARFDDQPLAVHKLDVSGLLPGVYQLIVTGKSQQWIERIVITE